MATPATERALEGLRELGSLEWYVIPLLAIVFYIYSSEMKKARSTGDWNAVFAGLAVFGMDFINETWNGWVFHFTQRSALWTTPGKTALRTMVGWNIEIMFMFAIAGIIYYNTISEEREQKVLGIPDWWFWAFAYSAFCVLVECVLNAGGYLVWEYPWWNRSFKGVWLIFLFGYFHFFVAALLVIGLRSLRSKLMAVGSMYGLAVSANAIALGLLKWRY